MAQSLLKLAGLDWEVPDFSTVSRRQKYLALEISANATTTGLHLLVDSTGIKMLGEGEWKTKKHGTDYRRQWRKMHLGIDATTLEIRAIEVTDNATGDAPMLSRLLDQIGTNEVIASDIVRHLNGTDFQGRGIYAQMHLAPLPTVIRAMLLRFPFTFAQHLDAGTVDQQVQPCRRCVRRNLQGKILLAAANGAEIGNLPIQSS